MDNKIADVDELKTRMIEEWVQFDQSLLANGVVVYALVSVYSGHTLGQFWHGAVIQTYNFDK